MRTRSLPFILVSWFLFAAVVPSAGAESRAHVDDPAQLLEWTDQFGSSSTERVYGVESDIDGNVYVAGYTTGALPGQVSSGGDDGFIRKYSSAGTVLWTDQFGSSSSDRVIGLGTDPSGNVYTVGATSGALPGQVSSGGGDGFIRKYDSAGSVVWTDQFGTSSVDSAHGRVGVDASGNIYVAGHTYGAFPGQSNLGSYDAFIRKYDSAGTVLWTEQLGTSSVDRVYGGAVVDNAGNVYIAGHTHGTFPGQAASGGYDAFIGKNDSTGAVLWTEQFGSAMNDAANDIAVDDAGNLYVAGETAGALPGHASGGGYDGFVRKYDSTGAEAWTDQIGTTAGELVEGVAVDGGGNVYVAGSTGGTLPGQASIGGADAFLRKYDPTGTVVWTDQFGSTSNDHLTGTDVDGSWNVYVGGYAYGPLPGQTYSGGGDGLVRRYGCAETPQSLLSELVDLVEELNLENGITNSLDAKLTNAVKALEDVNQNNDIAAINKLEAFVNEVEAQSGNRISTSAADALIAIAQRIIDLLSA